MLEFLTEIFKPDAVTRYSILDGGKPLTFIEVVSRWRTDEPFRSFFTKMLADSPFPAYRWETPPLSMESQGQDFQFVLLNAPRFAERRTDANTFKSKFTTNDENFGVVSFANLSGDATMIVPSPRTDSSAYGHLAAFLRNAPNNQSDAFWRITGEVVESKISKTPFWVNTAGGGVAWLHLRLDSRPKYYGYTPYKITGG